MVAVFTGTGLGLFNSSYTQLGGASGGSVGIGQSRGRQYVNVANGNLVLQDLDESLLVRGLNASFLRTYNSRGTVAGAGADGWVTGFERNVVLGGTLNQAGSTVTLNTGDGQGVVFTYSGTANKYVTTVGDGAHDTLTWNGTALQWTYVEGSTQREELYANHADATLNGRLIRIRGLLSDGTTPAQFDVVYDANNRVSEVRSVDDQATATARDSIVFVYDNATTRLLSVSTRENGVLKSQLSYGYEDLTNRLLWVQTDLTPELSSDNTSSSNNDGKLFRTTYSYVSPTASDLRIASATTSDGVTVAYTYESDGAGGYRVKTVTQGSAGDGSAQTTTFIYGTNSTDVVDGAGRTWTYQYDANQQLTAVLEPAVNGLRQKTSYVYDASGNVTRISQAGDANNTGTTTLLDTVFQYDGNGNRTLQRDRLGNTVVWIYNGANQVLTETRYTGVDPDGLDAGNTNTLGAPTGALTSNYIYDTRNRLRFVVNAVGEVRELTYATSGNGIGQVASERRYLGASYTGTMSEAALNTWATDAVALRKASSVLSTYSYDAKGRLSQTVEYASVGSDVNGNGVLDAATAMTSFLYDAQGLLRQQVAQRGSARTVGGAAQAESEVVDYLYDGMGRLLSTLKRSGAIPTMPDPRDPANATAYANWQTTYDVGTVLTSYAYVDSANQLRVTFDTGLIRTEARNKAGQILSSSEAGIVNGVTVTRITLSYYDNTGRLRATQDAAGARTYYFYDGDGRLCATVDGTGAVTQTVYDSIGRVVQVVAYATRVDTTNWLNTSTSMVMKDTLLFAATAPTLTASQAWVATDATRDMVTQRTYDNAGRLATETVVGVDNTQTQKTSYTYDAAHRLLQVSITDGAGTAATARTTRYLYDAADRRIAEIDAKNYVTETVYDLAGRVVKSIRYANATATPAATTLAGVRPTLDAANDQTTRLLYDGRGNLIGELNAEGYLTEFVYDEALNQRAVKAYAKKLTGLTGAESLATLRTAATTAAPAEAFRQTQRTFNALGQLLTELNPEGTVTRYSYDEAGRLVRTESGYGSSEVREGNVRYDVFGNVIGEISGEQVAQAMAALTGGKLLTDTTLTPAQLDAVYAQYGVTHSVDLLGRRTESVDAQGNKTWYFYDGEGRQTFVVKGQRDSANLLNAKGEVTETRYDAFGHVIDSIAYTGQITIPVPGSRASVQSAIGTLAVLGSDSRVQFSYDRRGLLIQRTDAEGYSTRYTYTSFGELATQQDLEANGSTVRKTTSYTYDARGQLTTTNEAGGGLSRTVTATFDAFGRTLTQTDARGTVTSLSYDRLGRMLSQSTTIGGRPETVSMTYDAYGRVLTQTDAKGNATTYSYSDTNRSMTVTTPENVVVTTVHNRFGQTVTVSQPLPGGASATTTTVYDKNGQISSVTDPLGKTATNSYDVRGLLVSSVDESGRRIDYSYDAVGRVLTRREDPTGLNLTTTYTYDGQGRQLQVTDASGRITAMAYDRKGNLIQTVLDPNGLALKTTYTWDRDGQQLTVKQGVASNGSALQTTQYTYDALGRRISEIQGAGSLNLTTTYSYDANNNVTSRTDGSGRVTRYSYDAANRLRFTVDGLGGISEVAYDVNGRVTMTRRYAKAANIATLSATPSEQDVATLIASQTLSNNALDEVNHQLYDRDGRVVLMVDGAGDVGTTTYDSAGRKLAERQYTVAMSLNDTLRASLKAGTATLADFNLAALASANDSIVRNVYDAAGQLRYSVDATGAVSGLWYDAAGRVVATRQFAQRISTTLVTDAITQGQIEGAVGPGGATDAVTLTIYDQAGRARFTLRGKGDAATYPTTVSVTEQRYDGAGRVLSTWTYLSTMTLDLTTAAKISSGNGVEADMNAFVTANAGNVLVARNVYDAAGRLTGKVDGTGSFTRVWYDAANRISVTRAFTSPIATAGLNDATTVAQLDALIVWGATDDLRMYVYDAAGRQRYALQAVGSPLVFPFTANVSETSYDGAGRVLNTRVFTQLMTLEASLIGKLGAGTATTNEAEIVSFVAANAATAQSQRNVYDAAGRLKFVIDGTGAVSARWYDAAGRVVVTRRMVNPVAVSGLSDATTAMQAEAMLTWGATDDLRMYVYDAAGRQRYALQAVGSPLVFPFTANVSETSYDGAGRALSTRAFTQLMTLDATLIGKLGAGTATEADFTAFSTANAGTAQSQRSVYDAGGNQIYNIDATGGYTRNWYDGQGRLTATRRFATRFNPATLSDTTTVAQLDVQLVWNAADENVYRIYDAAGRVRFQYNSAGQLQEMVYDGAGRILMARSYVTAFWGDAALDSKLYAGTATDADFATFVATNAATAQSQRSVYDAAGNQIYSIDATGAFTRTWYDGQGRVVAIRKFAARFNPAGLNDASTVAQLDTQLGTIGAWSADYQHEYRVYDAAGQLRIIYDGASQVTRMDYDGAGRVVATRRYADPFYATDTTLTGRLFAGTATEADFASFTAANDSTARVQAQVYDASGRVRYALQRNYGQWTVSEQQYDGAGRTTQQTRFGVTIAYTPGQSEAQVYAAIQSQLSSDQTIAQTQKRTTRYLYDAAGQQRFVLDATDAVSEQRYDGAGRVTETRSYGVRPPNNIAIDIASVTTWAGTQASADIRKVSNSYNAAGQLTARTDALNKSENFSYDGAGRMTSRTDRNGALWQYQYDAAGRKTAEISPQTEVYSITAQGVLSVQTRSIVTRYTYDGLSQVLSKSEDADGASSRTTQYTYDTRGLLIRTTLPNPGKIDPATGNLIFTGPAPTIETTYNALGQAVVVKDELNNYSYKTYDVLGRVSAEVDQEKNVTTYQYNAYGEQTRLLRYAATLNTAASAFTTANWQTGQVISWAQIVAGVNNSDAANRAIFTAYNQLGQKTEVTLSAVEYRRLTDNSIYLSGTPTTRFEYNAYGEVVKERVLQSGSTDPNSGGGFWAETYRYYDKAGRTTHVIDAEGYLTTMEYNTTGEVVKTIEYARAVAQRNAPSNTSGVPTYNNYSGSLNLSTTAPPAAPAAGDAATGYDREMRWTYDVLGRKVTETQVRQVTGFDGAASAQQLISSFGYDNEDRVTQLTNAQGTTVTTYNALGQVIAVREPTRAVLTNTASTVLQVSSATNLASASLYEQRSPYTTMAYDGQGRLVATRRHANGHDGVNPPAIDNTRDQISLTAYDALNRVVMSQNAVGDKTWFDYDAAGHLTHSWSRLEGADDTRDVFVHRWFSYDKTGRQTGASATRTRISDNVTTVDQSEAVQYNAFGEIASKTYGGITGTLQYVYDNAGRLISDNSTGAIRSYAYNLAGQQIRESHWIKLDLSTAAIEVSTTMTVDGLGRSIKAVVPTHALNTATTAVVLQKYDRWGNVIQTIDARGYQADYEYNDSNQLTKEMRPLVWVVGENGAGSWQRPVNQRYYDVMGRLIGTRDANGNLRKNTYDAVGQQTAMTDGLGNITRYAFDVLGHQRLTEDALGHITWQDYDQGDRITAIGDYLSDGATRGRYVQQSYLLNQNGDRLTMINALGNVVKYDYDSQKRLTRSETAMGVVMNYTYDVQGRKILESSAASYGAYQDRDGQSGILGTLTWEYDAFGRVTDHNNLGGRDSNYEYDAQSGMLMRELGAAWAWSNAAEGIKTISYYASGAIRQIVETNGGTYRYEYDAAGNRTMEEVKATDAYGLQVHTVTRTVYDSNNRILRVTQDDVDDAQIIQKRVFELRYDYDANGNRRRVLTNSGYGPNVQGVTVTNSAPVAVAAPRDRGVRPGEISSFRLLFSDVFRDAENDALTLTITQANGSALPSWLTASRDAQTGEIVFTANVPAGTADTDVVVKLTAAEIGNPSNTGSTTFTVKVRQNHVPALVVNAVTDLKAVVGQAFSRDLSASAYFTDLDVNETLTLSASGANWPSWLTLETSGGLLRLRGTPPAAQTYSFTLRGTDSRGAYAERTLTVTAAVNQPPVVVAAPAPQDATIGRAFTWAAPLSQVFSDANGDALQVTVIGLPAWLSFDYQAGQTPPMLRIIGQVPPDATNNQTFNVTLTATEGSGASVSTTLQVRVTTNVPPQAPTVPTQTVKQNLASSVVLPAFGDENGDALTYSIVNLPPGLSFNAATRTISGTPTTPGSWLVAYNGSDGSVLSTTYFTLTVQANTAPTAPTLTNATAGVGGNTLRVLPSFTDADSDTLTHSISNLPPGLSFNATTRTISGTPTTAGSWIVTYTANDGRGGVTSATFSYTISAQPVNQPPQLVGTLGDAQAQGSQAFTYTVPANVFVDPEGATLTYSYSILSSDTITSWLSFNAGTRTFTGTPYAAQDGTIVVRVTVTDPQGATAYDDFVITVIPSQGGGGGQSQAYSFEMGMEMGPGATTTSAAAGNTTLPVQTQEQWFTYDAENRLKIVNGVLSGAAGAAGTGITLTVSNRFDSYEQGYDAAGHAVLVARKRADQYGQDTLMVQRSVYDLRGQRQYEFHAQTVGTPENGIAKRFSYDAAGRLIETRSYYSNQSTVAAPLDGEGYPRGNAMSIGGWLSDAEQQSFDADGRIVWQKTMHRTQMPTWSESAPSAAQWSDLSLLALVSRVDYTNSDGSSGYDSAGRLGVYRYTAGGISWSVQTFTTSYEGWDSWQEKTVLGVSTNYQYRATSNTLTYDAFGRLVKQVENTPLPQNMGVMQDRVRAYTNTGDGVVLTRREGVLDSNSNFTQTADSNGAKPNYRFVHAAGRQQAELAEAGQIRMGTSTYTLPQIKTLNGSGPYQANGGMVVVQQGETLRTLAQRIYGTDTLWYLVADANGMSDPEAALIAGTQLDVPSASINSNDANTFKPYNPNDAIGSTAPSLPFIPPPPGQKCKALSTLIGVVVNIVVSYYAGPVAGAAAGNLATQGSALMLNGQYDWGRMIRTNLNPLGGNRGDMGRAIFDPLGNGAPGMIDYESVAISAAAAYVGGGVAGAAGGGVTGAMAGAAASYATTYALNRAMGRDASFSLRGFVANVAAAGVTAAIFGGMGKDAGSDEANPWGRGAFGRAPQDSFVRFEWSKVVVQHMAINLAKGAISYGVNRAFGVPDTHWNTGEFLASALGNTIGSGLTGQIAPQVNAVKGRWQSVERTQARVAFEQRLIEQGKEIDRLGQAIADLQEYSRSGESARAAPAGGVTGGSGMPMAMLLTAQFSTLLAMGSSDGAKLEVAASRSGSINADFDRVMAKLGNRPIALYSEAINRLLYRSSLDQWFSFESYGITMNTGEVESFASVLGKVGIDPSSYTHAPQTLAMLVPDNTSVDALVNLIRRDALGTSIRSDEIKPRILQGFDIKDGVITQGGVVNLTDLYEVAVKRINSVAWGSPRVIQQYGIYLQANDEPSNSLLTQKDYARMGLEMELSQARRQLAKQGVIPARMAKQEFLTGLYKVILEAATSAPGAFATAKAAQPVVISTLRSIASRMKSVGAHSQAVSIFTRTESLAIRLRREELNANRDNVIDPLPQTKSKPVQPIEIPKNLRINGLDDLSHTALDPNRIRAAIDPKNGAWRRYVQSDPNEMSIAVARVHNGDSVDYFVAVSGANKFNIPKRMQGYLELDGVSYRIINEDSESLKSMLYGRTGRLTNANHAEQTLMSRFQDVYRNKEISVDLAVQNTSIASPGMCPGCKFTAPIFARDNPTFSINIYHGTTGKRP